MRLPPRCPVFRLGAPTPVQCRLPEGSGGVGAARQCVSEQGVVRQRITVWEPPGRLAFRMEETDLFFDRFVDGLDDTFELAPRGSGTLITRTTRVSVRRGLAAVLLLPLWVGLKAVHRYVFRNWQHLRPT